MTQPGFHGMGLSVDPGDLADEDAGSEFRTADPEVAFSDYSELARLLRAADAEGDRAAMAQIREEMDALWPSLTDEHRQRIEDGELDW